MHYYQKNIGDYARDTGHLTALEHGVYMLLLDWYYLNERPISLKEAVRVSRGNPEETQSVLSEFFKETSEGWINSYADRLIEAFHAKAEINKLNGSKGGRPRREEPKETQSVISGNPEETLTKNQEPITKNQKIKSSVQPAAAPSRFDDFWSAYPNKKGKQDAEKRWKRDKLDGMADSIIAHVRMMQAQDDGWQRGYVPMGSTYLNQARWTDEPQAAPRASQPQSAPSKGMQAIMEMEGMKSGRLDEGRNSSGLPAAGVLGLGAPAGPGPDAWDRHGLGCGTKPQSGVGSGTGCTTPTGRILDHDG